LTHPPSIYVTTIICVLRRRGAKVECFDCSPTGKESNGKRAVLAKQSGNTVRAISIVIIIGMLGTLIVLVVMLMVVVIREGEYRRKGSPC